MKIWLLLLDNTSFTQQSNGNNHPVELATIFTNSKTGDKIMTTLRENMKQEMQLIGLAESTQKRYLQAVIQLRDFYQQSPAKLSVEQIRSYLLHLKKSH